MKEAPKPERPLFLDMDFGEALARFAQTKPEEVTPPAGRNRKAVRSGIYPKPDGQLDKPD